MTRDSALTTGKIANALTAYLPHQRLYRRKVGIFAHTVCAEPLVVPLGDVVIGLHGQSLLPHARVLAVTSGDQTITFAEFDWRSWGTAGRPFAIEVP